MIANEYRRDVVNAADILLKGSTGVLHHGQTPYSNTGNFGGGGLSSARKRSNRTVENQTFFSLEMASCMLILIDPYYQHVRKLDPKIVVGTR